jgi:rubrerythrin
MGMSNAAAQALQQALELEKSGQAFYTQAAARTADPQGKEMFRYESLSSAGSFA